MGEGLWPVGHLLAACHLWDPIDLWRGSCLGKPRLGLLSFTLPRRASRYIRILFSTRRHLQSCAPVGCLGARDTYMPRTYFQQAWATCCYHTCIFIQGSVTLSAAINRSSFCAHLYSVTHLTNSRTLYMFRLRYKRSFPANVRIVWRD